MSLTVRRQVPASPAGRSGGAVTRARTTEVALAAVVGDGLDGEAVEAGREPGGHEVAAMRPVVIAVDVRRFVLDPGDLAVDQEVDLLAPRRPEAYGGRSSGCGAAGSSCRRCSTSRGSPALPAESSLGVAVEAEAAASSRSAVTCRDDGTGCWGMT